MAPMPRLILLAVLAAAAFATVAAQAGTSKRPFVWGRPRRLVGTPYASEITAIGNGKYAFKRVTTNKPLYITYNKTPHELYLSRKKFGKELGRVAPAEYKKGKVYRVKFPRRGRYYINDVYKNYDRTENAYLPVTFL